MGGGRIERGMEDGEGSEGKRGGGGVEGSKRMERVEGGRGKEKEGKASEALDQTTLFWMSCNSSLSLFSSNPDLLQVPSSL
jgi:hypothetical protein